MDALHQMFPTPKTEEKKRECEDYILITLFLGANDSAAYPSWQHVPLVEYKQNMKIIIDHLKNIYTNAVFILVTPPTVRYTKIYISMQIFIVVYL